MAVFRVERNTGYTVMSNHHLRNKELSLKAKGLLSQKHIPQRGISQEEAGRDVLVGGTVGNRLFPHTDPGFDFTLQPGMGGMADGLPTGVDGNLLWGIEPADIPCLAPDKKDRAKRLKTLGNAVVPAQVYPILRYIADIELGRCREWCVFSENGGAGLSSS